MKPNSRVVQLFVVKSENFGINGLLVDSTSFIDSANGQPLPSNYGNSMIYISVSSHDTINVTFSDVRIQSNTVGDDNGNILSLYLDSSDAIVYLKSCTFLNNSATIILSRVQAKNLNISNSTF